MKWFDWKKFQPLLGENEKLIHCLIFTYDDAVFDVYWNGKEFVRQCGYDSELFEHIKAKDIIAWIPYDEIAPNHDAE